MEIIYNRKNDIKPEDMVDGELYNVTLCDKRGEKEKYLVMGAYSANLDVDIEDDEILLVALTDGMLFTAKYDEFEKIELLNAKLIID